MTIKMKIKEDEEQLIVEPKVKILKLSASSMKTYDQCPKKYFYNYIAKEPRKKWAHFDLGNLCHRTLEIFHQIYIKEGTGKRTLSKIMAHSFKEARKEFPNMSNELVAEAKQLVGQYLSSLTVGNMPHVKGVETEFRFNIAEDILIRGFLDRLDILNSGMFHILDYKTTKNTRYLDEFQLLLYGLWLKHEYPDVNEFKASYVLLRHKSKLKSYIFNTEDIDKVRKKVVDYANKINNSIKEDIWTPIPTKLCSYCDFKEICPTQQGW